MSWRHSRHPRAGDRAARRTRGIGLGNEILVVGRDADTTDDYGAIATKSSQNRTVLSGGFVLIDSAAFRQRDRRDKNDRF